MSVTPFDESEAARRLGISKATLARERLAGRISPIRIGQRIIRYTDDIISEYLRQCRNAPEQSVNTGSASAEGRTSGVGVGTTPPLGRSDAHLLALRTFKRAS